MSSVFSWIDHSERQRRRVLDAISLFNEQGTVDELGIGTIRDAIADLLFPGTTSIQTRARYFFFVPWMYQELERQQIPPAQIAARARRYEIALVHTLAQSGDTFGLIGKQAGATLQRLPSTIYWSGLRTLRILVFPGSQEEYHRAFERFHGGRARVQRSDDGEIVGVQATSWRRGIPPPPPGFPEGATFALTREEAEYLRERVCATHPESLFAFFASHLEQRATAEFLWDHPLVSPERLPDRLWQQVTHARRFSLVMHGAALLYNLMLAEAVQARIGPRVEGRDRANDSDRVDGYRLAMKQWADEVESCRHELGDWALAGFWTIARASDPTRRPLTERFVEAWVDLVLRSDRPHHLADREPARHLIRERELTLKRGRARLANGAALERWQGASGTERLNFRWRNAKLILNDMALALGRGGDA